MRWGNLCHFRQRRACRVTKHSPIQHDSSNEPTFCLVKEAQDKSVTTKHPGRETYFIEGCGSWYFAISKGQKIEFLKRNRHPWCLTVKPPWNMSRWKDTKAERRTEINDFSCNAYSRFCLLMVRHTYTHTYMHTHILYTCTHPNDVVICLTLVLYNIDHFLFYQWQSSGFIK